MKRPALITTPFPTADEVAKDLGVSGKRVRELRTLIGKISGFDKSSATKLPASKATGAAPDRWRRASSKGKRRKTSAK